MLDVSQSLLEDDEQRVAQSFHSDMLVEWICLLVRGLLDRESTCLVLIGSCSILELTSFLSVERG